MKGGTRILAYEITVLLGSAPFIIFLTRRAEVLGLNSKSVFFLTVYLCGDVMLFPWALRLGWIYLWILSIIVLFMLSILWPKILINKTKDNGFSSEINVYAENVSEEVIEPNQSIIEEVIEPVHMVIEEVNEPNQIVSQEASQMNVIEEKSPWEEKVFKLSMENLLDLGFQEKQAENFEKAASYFYQALSKDPLPDLAFSLIIDCYWLWNNLGERDSARTQLQTYIRKYLPLFNTELRLQFEAWMVKEDLQILQK